MAEETITIENNNNLIFSKIDSMIKESFAMFMKNNEFNQMYSFLNYKNAILELEKIKQKFSVYYLPNLLLKLLKNKGSRTLKVNFRKFLLCGFCSHNKESSKSLPLTAPDSPVGPILDHQSRLKPLKRMVSIKKNKNIESMRSSFYQFLTNGLIVQNLIFKKEKQIAEEKIRLQKLMQEKEEERKRILKKFFTRYSHNCISNTLKEAIRQDKIKKEEEFKKYKMRKLKKIVLQKEEKYNKKYHNVFMKFYFGGLYRKIVHKSINIVEIERKKALQNKQNALNQSIVQNENQPSQPQKEEVQLPKIVEEQKVIEAPKKEEVKQEITMTEQEKKDAELDKKVAPIINRVKARELRKLLVNKTKTNKGNLKVYFTKFYLAGLMTTFVSSIRKSCTMKTPQMHVIDEESEDTHEETHNEKTEQNVHVESDDPKVREIQNKFKKVFYQKERTIFLFINSNFKKWNLRTKIIKIKGLTEKTKPKKKIKRCKTAKTTFKRTLPVPESNTDINEENINSQVKI